MREGLGLFATGLLIGLAAAVVSARLMAGFLYAVPAIDPITLVLAAALPFIATLAACLIPGIRAATVDPMNTLRHE